MTPFTRSGFLLQWYTSYPRTATRSTPAMVLSTPTWDDTCVNAVSSPPTLFQTQQPHCRLLPDLISLHHSLHPQCLWLQSHIPQLLPHASCPKGHHCAYNCNTPCHPCAAQEIKSCSHHTQAPDSRDVTIPQPTRGDPRLGVSPDFVT